MTRLPFPLAVEPLAELAHQFALGPGQAVVVDGDSQQALFLPAVALDLVRVAAVTAIALGCCFSLRTEPVRRIIFTEN
jgi:hypothetical protein